MTLVGLDLNDGRACAVQGSQGDFPAALPLGADAEILPLTLCLEGRQIEVGRVGEKLRRRLPHLTCHGYLPRLGETHRWSAGKHSLDSMQALETFWRALPRTIGTRNDIVLALPGYLSRWQCDQARHLALKAGLNVMGSLPAPLAAALSSYADQQWTDSVVVVDLDEHALCLALVDATGASAHLREVRQFPQLGGHAWRERLINAVADCCVLQTRRDPRDCGQAEQGIYDQLDFLTGACVQGRLAQLTIGGSSWFQNLVIAPEETTAFCGNLVRHAVREIKHMLTSLGEHAPQAVLLTANVGRLPGLTAAISRLVDNTAETPAGGSNRPPSDDDFGINLLQDSGEDGCGVFTLARGAAAQGAYGLAAAFQRGDLPHEHLEAVAPLPIPWPAEVGPARLTCQGNTFTLDGSTFLIGTQPGCQLLVDAKRHPDATARHCEIYFDHRTYVLFNRAAEGTRVNDAIITGTAVLYPGDRIHLGGSGPVIKFLGGRA